MQLGRLSLPEASTLVQLGRLSLLVKVHGWSPHISRSGKVKSEARPSECVQVTHACMKLTQARPNYKAILELLQTGKIFLALCHTLSGFGMGLWQQGTILEPFLCSLLKSTQPKK